jgi:hypothetical protein
MSIILHIPVLRTKKVTKPKHGEPNTSSILLISAAISIAIVLLTFVVIPYTETWFEQYSMCRDKIIGFEQMGLYKSPEDFRLALSYCDLK